MRLRLYLRCASFAAATGCILSLLVLAFCRCCCLHFVVAAAAACMQFATAAWIKMLELYVFSESLFVVNCKVEWDVGWKLM